MSDVRPRVQPRVSPVRRQRLAAWLLLAFPVVFVLVLVSTQGFPRMIALDLMEIVTPLAAGIACLLASRKAGDRRVSRFWLLMSLALFLSSAAEATWAWYELVLHVEAPYPSLADVLWLCFYPLAVAAFLQLVPSRGTDRYAAWTMVLDVLLFAVASALVIWQFIVLPRLDLSVGWVVNLTTLGYPVGDVLLLAAVASLALMPSKARVPRGVPWLALGFLVNIEADLAYLLAEAAGTYTTASWIDPLWPLAYALMGFGALAFLERSGRGRAAHVLPESTSRQLDEPCAHGTSLRDRSGGRLRSLRPVHLTARGRPDGEHHCHRWSTAPHRARARPPAGCDRREHQTAGRGCPAVSRA